MSTSSADTPASHNGDAPQVARIFLRPIASPFALGFIALAVATVIASGTELGWIPSFQQHEAAILIIAFAPGLQLLASWVGFLARDAVAGTAMAVLSGTWLCVGLSLLLSTPGSHSPTLALLLFTAGAGILISAVIAMQNKLVPALVLLLAAARFALTGLSEWGYPAAWGHAAGWTGIALAVGALYGALSLELEAANRRTVLPTLRRGSGRLALEPRLDAQLDRVAAEPGVRAQL
jgi:succinate-acetate transporter protein